MASMSRSSSAETLRPPAYQETEPEVFHFRVGFGTNKRSFHVSRDDFRRHSLMTFSPGPVFDAIFDDVEPETFQVFLDFIGMDSEQRKLPIQSTQKHPIHISVKAWVLGQTLEAYAFRDQMMKRVTYYYNKVNSRRGQPCLVWKVTPELVEYLCTKLQPNDLLWKFFTDFAAQSYFMMTYPSIANTLPYHFHISTIDWGEYIPWRWVVTRKRFPAWEEALFADSITLPEASGVGLSTLRNNLIARRERSKSANNYIKMPDK